MAEIVYMACAATSFTCAVLLWVGYRRHRARLLFWSGACFAGLTIENVLLFIDRIVLPDIDLSVYRLSAGLAALTLLIYGLVVDSQ